MGASIPVNPESYRPRSVILLQEKLTKEILDHIEQSGWSPPEATMKIRANYPTFRIGYIHTMQNGGLFGVSRLLSICEALGILLVWQTARTQRQQIAQMEAA